MDYSAKLTNEQFREVIEDLINPRTGIFWTARIQEHLQFPTTPNSEVEWETFQNGFSHHMEILVDRDGEYALLITFRNAEYALHEYSLWAYASRDPDNNFVVGIDLWRRRKEVNGGVTHFREIDPRDRYATWGETPLLESRLRTLVWRLFQIDTTEPFTHYWEMEEGTPV